MSLVVGCASRRRKSMKGDGSKPNISCGVCGIEVGKYKCPKCRLPYCSVKCCKEHKLKCPVLQQKEKKDDPGSVTKENTSSNSKYLPSDALNIDPIENARKRRQMLDDSDSDDDSLDENGWRITKEMMDRMHNSAWLRKELSDGGLRQLIAEIDNADWEKKNNDFTNSKKRRINQPERLSPREVALERSKYTNEKFSKFLDRLMLTAGILAEKEPQTPSESIAALISGDINSNNLSLVAVPSKRKPDLTKTDNLSSSSNSSDDETEQSTSSSDGSESESEDL